MNLRHITQMYGLEDPLLCLEREAPTKSDYKDTVMSKITAFHEHELRMKAGGNEYMIKSQSMWLKWKASPLSVWYNYH